MLAHVGMAVHLRATPVCLRHQIELGHIYIYIYIYIYK